MAVGSEFAKRVQAGVESTRGTAVPATFILLPDQNGFSAQERRLFHQPQDERVLLERFVNTRRQLAGIEEVSWSFQGDATYEQLPYFLNGVIEPATVTGTGPYTYTYAPNYAASNAQKTYTIEYGDDLQAYEIEFAYLKTLTMSGGAHSPVKMSAQGGARQKSEVSFTGSLTAPTVETIMGNSCQLYYGTSWSNLTGGGTLATATLIDWSITMESGLMPSKRTDGTDYFTLLGEGKRQLFRYSFTLEFNTIANSTLDLSSDFQAGTQQWFEIRTAGSSSRSLKIQMAVTIDDYQDFAGVQDGINVIRISGGSHYDTTGTASGQVILVNGVETLP